MVTTTTDFDRKIATTALVNVATARPANVPNNADQPATVALWADCIAAMRIPRIVDLWREAVTHWIITAPPAEMFTPAGLRASAKHTMSVWDRHPEGSQRLAEYRFEARRDRVRRGELPKGSEDDIRPESRRETPTGVILGQPTEVETWRDRMKRLEELDNSTHSIEGTHQ